MGHIIYNCLNMIFAGDLVTSLSEWMNSLLTTMDKAVNGNAIAITAMNIFAGVACAMMIVYFYMDLTAQASRSAITFEQLVAAFIKLLVAVAILSILPDLIGDIVSIAKNFFGMMADGEFKTMFDKKKTHDLSFSFGSVQTDKFPEWSDVEDVFKNHYGGVKWLGALGIIATCLIVFIVMVAANVVGYFLTTSCMVMFLVRCIFSPLAVVQCFDEGARSSGIRYIKILVADALTLGIMIGIIYIGNYFTAGIVPEAFYEGAGSYTLSFDTLETGLSGMILVKIIDSRLAIIGGMAGAGRLSREIMGA